jgi:predicted DNA-binding transcriptional regulator AlpA
MFTEEQVAELLQVSLSKLRKWRMRKNDKAEKGPPFRKLGRLVRYPEAGLDAYVNGD